MTVVNLTNWFSGDGSYGIGFQVVARDISVYNTSRLDFAAFDVFGAPYENFASSWPNSSTTSSTCSLWMCVKSLSVTTQTSSQIQTVNSTFSKTAHILSADDILGSGSVNFANLPAEMNPRPGANYSVDALAFLALQEFILSLADGNVTLNLESQLPSSDTVEAIWNGTVGGLDPWIKNLALSMTNVIRTSAPATDARYNGVAYQSGIQVRWEWLALPIAMVLISLLILTVVIIETSKAQVKPWKGSPLAYIMTDLDGAIKQNVTGADMNAFNGVERAVGRRRVVLDNQPNGRLIFRQAG